MTGESSFNAFADAQAQFDRLADLIGLDAATRAWLNRSRSGSTALADEE